MSGVHVVYELEICADCAVVIVNGDDSADPDRAARAFDAAYGVWGDDLARLVIADSQGEGHAFRCDYCREDTFGEKYDAVIFNK
jgi:hypothetical protein